MQKRVGIFGSLCVQFLLAGIFYVCSGCMNIWVLAGICVLVETSRHSNNRKSITRRP